MKLGPGIKGVYEVGGHVRDQLLGIKSNDIDYAVEAESYQAMKDWITATHKKIFLETPECLTIRALTHENEARDYVMCRKDGVYGDGRRPDKVEPGTVYDDLARRDFTINAIAKNVITGEIYDPFGGIEDLKNNIIRCVGNTEDRMNEDALRILRAARFYATLPGFLPDQQLGLFLLSPSPTAIKNFQKLPPDRIREELHKMLKRDTPRGIAVIVLSLSPEIYDHIFKEIWFKPTMEKR